MVLTQKTSQVTLTYPKPAYRCNHLTIQSHKR